MLLLRGFQQKEHQVEKCLTKPYFKTGKTTGNLSTYRSFEPNARVIFPYRKSRNGKLKLIPLTKIELCYPGLYEYLMHIKPILSKPSRDIQPAQRLLTSGIAMVAINVWRLVKFLRKSSWAFLRRRRNML